MGRRTFTQTGASAERARRDASIAAPDFGTLAHFGAAYMRAGLAHARATYK